MLKLGGMQREQEMPLKNKNWQTDEVAEECKCDAAFPVDMKLRNRGSASTIGTQYKHSPSFYREHGQSTLDD